MTRKCKCEKCVYCKQIVTDTSVPRVNCEKYGVDIFKPTYCDKYLNQKESSIKKIIKEMKKNGRN